MINVSILLILIAQPWAKAYDRFFADSSFNDTAYSIACDTIDDAYVVVGHTDIGPLGGIDVLVTKVNAADGSVIWARAYGSSDRFNDYGRSVIVDYDDDGTTYYAVTGYTEPGFYGDLADVLVFKIRASDGTLVWGNLYNGTMDLLKFLDDYGYSIVKDGKDYLVAGNVMGTMCPTPCGGLSDALVLSVRADSGFWNWAWAYGKIAWDNPDFPTDDYLYSIIEDSSQIPCSLWVVAGKSYNEYEMPMSDILVFKVEKSNGTIDTATWWLYDYYLGFPWRFGCAYSIKNDPFVPGYILTGDIDSSIITMRLNPNLSVGWNGNCRIYTIQNLAGSRCIEPTSDKNYVFTGFTNPGIPGPFDLLMTKIDILGMIVWSKVLTGCPTTWMNLDDYGQCIIEYQDSFYVAAGYTDWPPSWASTNLLVAKVDANGDIPCSPQSDTCLQDIDTPVDSPEVYVNTSVCESKLMMEIFPIADVSVDVRDSLICGLSIGIKEIQNSQILLPAIMVYPNPLIRFTTIKYQIPVKCKVSLRIYDVSGRIVKTLVNEKENAGYHSVSFDTKGLKAGIYFAKLVAGDYKDTKKLTILTTLK